MNVNRKETICLLLKFVDWIERRRLSKTRGQRVIYFDELPSRVITPPMVSTPNNGGTSLVLGDDGEATMTTDVMETSNDPIFGKNQKDWISANIVSIVRAGGFESISVRQTVPCLCKSTGHDKRSNLSEDCSCFEGEEILTRVP